MEDVVKRLLRLNLEIDGNLRSYLARPCDDILDVLCEKVADFNALLATLNPNKSVEKVADTAVSEDIDATIQVAVPQQNTVSEPVPEPEESPEPTPVCEEVPTPEPEESPEPTPVCEEVPVPEPEESPEPTPVCEEVSTPEPDPVPEPEEPLEPAQEAQLIDEPTPALEPAIEVSTLDEVVSMFDTLTESSIQDAVSESDAMIAEVEKALDIEESSEVVVPETEVAPDIVSEVITQDDSGNIEPGKEATEPAEETLKAVAAEPTDMLDQVPDTETKAVDNDNAGIDVSPKPTIADVVSNNEYRVEDMIAQKKVVDLAKTFTINDKYRFVRGLFCEDRNDFEYTIAQISSFDSLGDVYNYLLNEQGWDIDNTEVKDFIKIITKYFNTINADY